MPRITVFNTVDDKDEEGASMRPGRNAPDNGSAEI